MSSRYKKPPPYGPGGADDYFAVLDWQDAELEHEDAALDGRRCRCDACNPPEKFIGYVAESCASCGGTVGPRAYGKCTKHWREQKEAEAAA